MRTSHRTNLDGGKIDNSTGATASPNNAIADGIRKIATLRTEQVMIHGSIRQLGLEIEKLSDRGPDQNSTKQLIVRLEELRSDNAVLSHELEAYKHVDPRMVQQKREEITTWKAEAERWSNNIAILESWLRRAFAIDEQQMEGLRRSCYGMDHMEDDARGKL